MTADPITDDPLLHDLYRLRGPVLTAYLNPPLPGPGMDDRGLRLRALLHELRGSGATPEALEALRSVLETLEPGRPPAAAFVGVDGQTRMFPLPGGEVTDQAHCAALPHVLPLLYWRQRHPAFATVMVDRSGAELVVQPAGAARPLRAEVPVTDRAAEAVADAIAEAGADLLIVGGDEQAEQYFLDHLPPRVRSEVTVKTIPGGCGHDGSPDHREDEVEAAVREHVDEASLRTLAQIQDHSGPGGLGVQGPSATIHALARGQVDVLLLTPGPSPRAEAGTAWFGPHPTDISEHRTGVLVPDGQPRQGPFDEVLARSAVLTEADIRLLPPDLADAPPHGVGALCRSVT